MDNFKAPTSHPEKCPTTSLILQIISSSLEVSELSFNPIPWEPEDQQVSSAWRASASCLGVSWPKCPHHTLILYAVPTEPFA